ncbi:MAG: phosphate propanoyltransferase [Firmicutes bacterium]|nr:phosphate propanoyltransferase [Bacillota bacterium]
MRWGETRLDDKTLIEEITRRVLAAVQEGASISQDPRIIPVGISVRHVHISAADLEVLYGPGHQLTPLRDLYQEGEFAAKERVALVGPKMRALEGVRILGPMRQRTQVEVSRTDAVYLGLNPPVRPSGNLEGSSPITLVGPKGTLTLPEGAIVANRHIHMNLADAQRFGVSDNDLVQVEVLGEKGLIFNNVQVRAKDSFRLEMHLDTDDANASGITTGAQARILGKQR